eukprot:3230949-Alexandrium_andersonii.AAC.1
MIKQRPPGEVIRWSPHAASNRISERSLRMIASARTRIGHKPVLTSPPRISRTASDLADAVGT